MALCSLARVAYSDVKHNFIIHYLIAAAVVFTAPVFFSYAELNERQAAQPLEVIISLIGCILLTPIFMPEQNESIRDVIRSKKTAYYFICLIRLILSFAVLAVLIGCSVLYMKHCDSKVTFRLFSGTLSSAVLLGAIGFFAAGVADNVIIGYMASLFYYMINFTLKEKMGVFYLFSMMQGSFEEKKWLIMLSLVLISITFGYLKLIKKQ
ncbi:MAG: hypothetical protein K6G33_08535 [Ruminococcus sp.]|uniref:hypothetical protein n=1 Tax=Ruminococcus sp. TaxID=41978 RepID=UPI0025E05DF4|nr:hypothetical protein [Ruminococcus sp.]MCR5600769.1 hypothetical protein [Ruminococcus sp.]